MFIRNVVSAVALVVALSEAAQAQIFPPGGLGTLGLAPATLFTPALTFGIGDTLLTDERQEFQCKLANVSPNTRTVRIRIRRGDGTVADDSGNSPLLPGAVASLNTLTPSADNFQSFTAEEMQAGFAFRYCEFIVQGFKSDFRGSATISRRIPFVVSGALSDSDFVAVPAQ